MTNRLLFGIAVFGLLLSINGACSEKKDETSEKVKEATQDKGATEGTVYYKPDSDCPMRIEIIVSGKKQLFYPVELPEDFREDMLKIRFDYTPSRAPQPAGCNNVSGTIILTNISKV